MLHKLYRHRLASFNFLIPCTVPLLSRTCSSVIMQHLVCQNTSQHERALAWLWHTPSPLQGGPCQAWPYCTTRSAAHDAHACRGSVAARHMPPHVARSVWAFCWALSLLQRTADHPPLALLQDLQVPSHACSSKGASSCLPDSTAGTVRMSMLLVAVQEAVLCLSFWPGADARAEDLRGKRAILGIWSALLVHAAFVLLKEKAHRHCHASNG